MLFSDVSPSREQVFSELADALVSKNTRIYLDASLLIRRERLDVIKSGP